MKKLSIKDNGTLKDLRESLWDAIDKEPLMFLLIIVFIVTMLVTWAKGVLASNHYKPPDKALTFMADGSATLQINGFYSPFEVEMKATNLKGHTIWLYSAPSGLNSAHVPLHCEKCGNKESQ